MLSAEATLINLGGPNDPAVKSINPKSTDAGCAMMDSLPGGGMASLTALLGKGASGGLAGPKGPRM
jgi:hypothetical protein